LKAFAQRGGDGAWRTRGLCNNVDPETFFPAPNEAPDKALALCRTCDVQGACLAWALDFGDCHGVWGATTPRERRAMLVAWRAEHGEQPAVAATASGVPLALITNRFSTHVPARSAPLASMERLPNPRRPSPVESAVPVHASA
jgi:hypothetical protein